MSQKGNNNRNSVGEIIALIGIGIVALFLLSFVVTLITRPQDVARMAVKYVVVLGCLYLGLRMLIWPFATRVDPMLKYGTHCPQCGSRSYSVKVVRRNYGVDPNQLSATDKTLWAAGNALCIVTHGLSDRILRFIPGVRFAHVRHDSRAECRNCHYVWTISKSHF